MANEIGLQDAKGAAAVAVKRLGDAAYSVSRSLSYDPSLSSNVFRNHVGEAMRQMRDAEDSLKTALGFLPPEQDEI